MTVQLLEHPDMLGVVVTHDVDGKELERRRRDLGWSQAALAHRAKVAQRTVQNAEGGHVSEKSHLRITDALAAGERERVRATEPDRRTAHYSLDTDKGEVVIVVTASKEAMRHINPAAILGDLLGD